jgi:putative copper export protein
MWFSEDLNPFSSHLIVVDPTNREVDLKDSHVNPSNSREMDISLPLLPAGTYVVVWRTQSAEDGHIVGGSYLFRVARPDGSVPPLPDKLPTGNVVGGAGVGATGSSELDGPTTLQALSTWIALTALAFWVGGVLWETWVLPPTTTRTRDLRAAAQAASARFGSLAPSALLIVLVANIGVVLGQSAALAGTWAGMVSPPLVRAVLFGSRFGAFWGLREVTALCALLLAVVARRQGWSGWSSQRLAVGSDETPADARAEQEEVGSAEATFNSGQAIAETVRGIPQLPRRLLDGWRGRSPFGQGQVVLGLVLLAAFALSGHAAAVPTGEQAYALSVDLLHLVCNALWLGGLFYISVVLVPALATLGLAQRARVLAAGLPEFSAIAIVSATLLAATGSLNTTIHLTSIQQFVTTAYGRVLFIKIELFLVMVGVSAYHAFALRPRLTTVLAEQAQLMQGAQKVDATTVVTNAAVAPGGSIAVSALTASPLGKIADPDDARRADSAATERMRRARGALVIRLEDWLRREALLGVGVLLCVALLGAFAGSLATPTTGASASSTASVFVQTKQTSDYAITLRVAPAAFGANTFTVTVKDKDGKALEGASVLVQTTMLDMDMGVQNVQLKPLGAEAPGAYSGQGNLTMAGHWQVLVKLLPPNNKDFVTTTYTLTAGY